MPPKSFICSICGCETTKPKSYAMPDGSRACRIHQEAQNSNVSNEEERKKKEERNYLSLKKHHEKNLGLTFLDGELVMSCGCCGAKGLVSHAYFQKCLKLSGVLQGTIEKTENMVHLENNLLIMRPLSLVKVPKQFLHWIKDVQWKNSPWWWNTAVDEKEAILCPFCQEQMGIQIHIPRIDMDAMATLVGITQALLKDPEYVANL